MEIVFKPELVQNMLDQKQCVTQGSGVLTNNTVGSRGRGLKVA